MRGGTAALSAFVSACCGGHANVCFSLRSATAMLMTTNHLVGGYNAKRSIQRTSGGHDASNGRRLSSATKKRSRRTSFLASEERQDQASRSPSTTIASTAVTTAEAGGECPQKRDLSGSSRGVSDKFVSALVEGGPSFNHMDPIARATLRWVRAHVVGLNLCPWASGALLGGHMRVVVYPELGEIHRSNNSRNLNQTVVLENDDNELEWLVATAVAEAAALANLQGPAAANATTLVIARPPLALAFDDFLAVAEAVNEFLDSQGLRGTVQLATFHPQFVFEGSKEEDASNFTNRSPYPVLHLLLENQVEAAIEQVGDPARVWQRNVETMKRLGADAMRRSVEACRHDPDNGQDRSR